jgi:hydroxypyruvate reductase
MANLTQLRLAAREIFNESLRAVDAGAAVRRAVRLEDARLTISDVAIDLPSQRPVYSIAIGKAAFAMASALDEVLGDRPAAGVISSSAPRHSSARGRGREQATHFANLRYKIFEGGHPEPNEQSLAAAQACFDLLRRANDERALVIFLISGGGSAMIEWPISQDITLADLRTANRILVNCGASIVEINAVRRVFSAIKGGRLAARAPHCDQITLIVSDVPPGEERNVASGPTLAPAADVPDAHDVVGKYDLSGRLPETVLRAIDSRPAAYDPIASTSMRKHFVLLDNQSALKAAAEAAHHRGFVTQIADDISDQAIDEGCSALLKRSGQLRERASGEPNTATACLISGGEFACAVRGDGSGGRNLETALRLVMSPDSSDSETFVALCAGTDGIDGNSPAAGAIVDSTTIERARAIGLDPQDFLNRSDAYSFFVALGEVIATGPTGTNVRDIRILLTSTEPLAVGAGDS